MESRARPMDRPLQLECTAHGAGRTLDRGRALLRELRLPPLRDEELLPLTKLAIRQGRAGGRLAMVSRGAVAAPLPGATEDQRLAGARVETARSTHRS